MKYVRVALETMKTNPRIISFEFIHLHCVIIAVICRQGKLKNYGKNSKLVGTDSETSEFGNFTGIAKTKRVCRTFNSHLHSYRFRYFIYHLKYLFNGNYPFE